MKKVTMILAIALSSLSISAVAAPNDDVQMQVEKKKRSVAKEWTNAFPKPKKIRF